MSGFHRGGGEKGGRERERGEREGGREMWSLTEATLFIGGVRERRK